MSEPIPVQKSPTILYPGTFNTVVTPVASPITTGLPILGTGYEYRSFSLSGSNGLAGKGFLRAKAEAP